MGSPGLPDLVLPVALAGLTIYFGFEAGGYFADTTGWVASGLSVALALSALALARPPCGLTRPLLLGAGALALFGLWTLLSGIWSDAPARALLEFDRVLLYLLTLLLFATARSPELTLRWLPPALALAAVVLCGAGVFARTLPGPWPFDDPAPTSRMDFPVSYANALGALASLGFVSCLHLASWRREATVTRILAAACQPVLAAALVLTFSRGALLAGVAGVLIYAALCRSAGLVTAVLAAAPFVALAAIGAYHADLLTSTRVGTPAGLAQGEELAVLIAVATGGAALLLAIFLRLERRLARATLPHVDRRVVAAGIALLAIGAVGALIASGTPERLYNNLFEAEPIADEQPIRERLSDPRGAIDPIHQRRRQYWEVALDAFREAPAKGRGAGTFEQLWARDRPLYEEAREGHSLYIEVLGELGLVGAVLVVAFLAIVLAPLVAGLRGSWRPLYAGLLATAAVWALHAGLDWDWEMPVLTLWLFAAGGCALAGWGRSIRVRGWWAWPVRLLLAGGCLLLALTPATISLSQVHLDRSADALEKGDCERSEASAREAASLLSVRPEPHALRAYCLARAGSEMAAVEEMELAVDRDPQEWEYRYGLAIVRGAAGLDPRRAIRAAVRLNPREPIVYTLDAGFSATDDRREWRRKARAAPLPIRGPLRER